MMKSLLFVDMQEKNDDDEDMNELEEKAANFEEEADYVQDQRMIDGGERLKWRSCRSIFTIH